MVVLLFGPPGSGKGTQSKLLSQLLSLEVISTGEMLRQAAREPTDFGRALAESLNRGELTGDETVNRIVKDRLGRINGRGLILDGYPRTVNQARFLEEELSTRNLPAPVVIHLDVPQEVIVDRLTARRQCICGRVYNIRQQRPVVDGKCDDCGSDLTVRGDDETEVVLKRLHAYRESTGPVLSHYTGPGYHPVDANRAPEEVFRRLREIVEPVLS